jgi:two-component system, OmpR family, copper resistance phosphate regulon response regulator CusR
MRILIIEDEKKTSRYLARGLSENGFVADVADHGEIGLHLARTGDYNLIILDLMLPERNGWSILSELRRANDPPIIILTACDSVQDRVKGLELGADDYLVKPFSFSELLARVRTILRRSPTRQPDVLHVADLRIDMAKHRVTRNGEPIDLSPREFLLLSLMARHTGEVLTRTRIMDHVWDINFESDSNVLDVAIRRLRQKVDDGFRKKLIHTVRGVGYMLEESS